jgi:hypothetical protein
MHDEIMTATAARPSTFTVDSCVSRITAEAARHVHAHAIHSARPGSEYANAATTSSNSNTNTSNVNPITGLHKHKHNPDGVFYTTPGCNKGDHDHDHCYRKGGGMEGQAPWMKNKKKEKDVAAAVMTTTSTAPAPAPAPAIAAVIMQVDLTSLYNDVSFASITEVVNDVSCSVSLPFSTILDSGTTVTLVKDRHSFHTYSTEDTVPVHTANYGVLNTTRRGMCIAWMTIGKKCLRVRLSNCLHAPNAMLNLLSISCMNAKGWDVNFKSNMTCELGYKGHLLGAIPATGKLYAVDLDFIPNTEALTDTRAPEFSAFVQAPRTLDLWHTRLGHLGRNTMTCLDKVAKGISFDSSSPLSTCESCIMAKHPHLLFHATETERASKFLELIHSDVCGPIPVLTPHFKRYFIVFLDDHTHILNLQLLASKDQALDA